MNSGSNDGPSIKKILVCDGCKWLKKNHPTPLINPFNRTKYFCYHPEMIFNSDNLRLDVLDENIKDNNLIKPPFNCPYVLKKLRQEKLNELAK